MNLQERMVLQEPATGRRFRVCLITPLSTWFMPIGEKAWPIDVSTPAAFARFRSGEYVSEQPDSIRKATEGATKHGDRVHERFKPFLSDFSKLMTPSGRTQLFKMMQEADEHISSSTFYKNLRKWLEGGCVPQAFDGNWKPTRTRLSTNDLDAMSYVAATKGVQEKSLRLQQAGKPKVERRDHTAEGVARKNRHLTEPTAYRVDRAALRVFLHHFRELRKKPGTLLSTVYDQMRREVFSTISPLGDISLWPLWSIPSFEQFKHWYYLLVPHRTRRVQKKGEHHFELNERGRPGQGVSIVYGAAVVASADATIWSVELVSDLPGADLIGPPVVFRIRCKDSGMLLGLGVSLENASWMGMASAIANCAEDKVAFCAKYGIKIPPDIWPVRGVPPAIEADCGETDNLKPERFVRFTKCELRNLPPARPDLKPGVESDFNTLTIRLNQSTPGAIIKEYEELTLDKFRLQGRMTLNDFIKMLLIEELKRMVQPRKSLSLPAAMVADEVDSSPLSMYRWFVENGRGGMRQFDENQVKLSLLDTDKGSLTESGIEFQDILYLAPEVEAADAMSHARRHGRRKLDIAYDPRLVNEVYILQGDPERPTGYTKCTLNRARPDQRDLWNKTFRAVRKLQESQSATNKRRQAEVDDLVANLTRLQEELAEAAAARAGAAIEEAGLSNAARLANRPAARAVAKEASSPGQAILPRTESAPTVRPEATADVVPITGKPQGRRGSGFASSVASLLPSESATAKAS